MSISCWNSEDLIEIKKCTLDLNISTVHLETVLQHSNKASCLGHTKTISNFSFSNFSWFVSTCSMASGHYSNGSHNFFGGETNVFQLQSILVTQHIFRP